MEWTRFRIIETLKKLYEDDANLSYNMMQKKRQALLSAAAYHFGSYATAIERAGIDYAEVLRRPRWTKIGIIKIIKNAKRKGQDLNWSAVTKRRDELGRAAFASMQKRLFGRWDRALSAAGLDADEVNRYRKWSRDAVTAELKELHNDGTRLSSGAIQKSDPGLHAAAIRYFGRYDQAVRSAGIDPQSIRQRNTWTRQSVIDSLRKLEKSGNKAKESPLVTKQAALYSAAVRLFGTMTAARKAAATKKADRKAK